MCAGKKLIRIVTPCYNEGDNIIDRYEAVQQVFAHHLPDYDYEHIFCDNGSTDTSEDRPR
jgi:glycosyltransferase involved in cell wall biosynthesis